MRKTMLLLAGLAVVAGCATPDESADDSADVDDTSGATPEYIIVNGATYECDDTINADGICDGYELNEGEGGQAGAQEVTASGDTITVAGHTYTCDNVDRVDIDVVNDTDTAGQCERYDRDE